jgi:hypothetical protein
MATRFDRRGRERMTGGAIGLLVGAALVLGGCAPGRLADLRDSGRLSLGLGLGISADAKAGALTHPSLGTAAASASLGFESRDVYGTFYQVSASDPHAMFWAHGRGKSWLNALNSSGWRAAFQVQRVSTAFMAVGSPVEYEPPQVIVGEMQGMEVAGSLVEGRWLPIPPRTDFNDATDFQLGATLLLVSARAGVNVLETCDFLLGFFGLDIAGDDPKP